MKSSVHFLLFAFVAVLFESGCNGTYQTTTRSELRELSGQGPIRVLTVDSLLYTFERFSFSTSELTGHGTLKQEGTVSAFEGTIPFARIVFIERLESSFWKGAWVIPMAAGVVAGLSAFSEPSKLEIRRPSGGSCPSLYAFNGTEFILEGEAFGTSISRSLEAKTFTVLPSLVSTRDRLLVRVDNDRPETHLINSVQLLAGDAEGAQSTVLDVNNVLWPVFHAVSPAAARDHSGRNALNALAGKDGHFWMSDLAYTAPFSGFRDHIEIEFDVPQSRSEATLIVKAINTDLITEVYRSVGEILGDATLEFYRALEEEPELQSTIRKWIRESSLRIEVDSGRGWEETGVIAPEATMVPFSRAIRINGLDNIQGRLRVRLSTMTDVWRIDAVSVDFSPARPISLHPLKMISVTSSDGMDWQNAITLADSSYALILPPHHLDISFDAGITLHMQKPVYTLAAQGYLYEWFPAAAESPASMFASTSITGDNRVELFKTLIQQKDMLLPAIYAKWSARPRD